MVCVWGVCSTSVLVPCASTVAQQCIDAAPQPSIMYGPETRVCDHIDVYGR